MDNECSEEELEIYAVKVHFREGKPITVAHEERAGDAREVAAMSRIAEGLAKKGSQKWLQSVVHESPEMQSDGLGFRDFELGLPTA